MPSNSIAKVFDFIVMTFKSSIKIFNSIAKIF
jgi:hypothetical protein